MKLRYHILMALLTFIPLVDSCTVHDDRIRSYDTGYIVRYSEVIVRKTGKDIPVPIYGGTEGSISEDEIAARYGGGGVRSGEQLVGNIAVPVKRGRVDWTVGDILKFYKKSLLKDADLDDPGVAGFEGGSPAILCYDFTWHGLPSSLMISVKMNGGAGRREKSKRSDNEGIIFIRIMPGSDVDSLNLHNKCR